MLFSGERFVRKCWITNDQLFGVSHYCGLTSMIHRTVCHILNLSHMEGKQTSQLSKISPCKTYICLQIVTSNASQQMVLLFSVWTPNGSMYGILSLEIRPMKDRNK